MFEIPILIIVTVNAVHKACVIITCGDTAPCLAGILKVAYVAVTYHDIFTWCPKQAAVVTACLAFGAVYETVGHGGVEGAVYDYAVKENAC